MLPCCPLITLTRWWECKNAVPIYYLWPGIPKSLSLASWRLFSFLFIFLVRPVMLCWLFFFSLIHVFYEYFCSTGVDHLLRGVKMVLLIHWLITGFTMYSYFMSNVKGSMVYNNNKNISKSGVWVWFILQKKKCGIPRWSLFILIYATIFGQKSSVKKIILALTKNGYYLIAMKSDS